MDKFYNNFTFIIAFCILTIAINMSFGSKFTEYFLLLVLLSIIILNAEKFSAITGKLSGGKNE